jgi:hypothetical protein
MRHTISSLYRIVACFLVMSLLTSGIAMAAYVCPQVNAPAQAEMMMEGQPCAGMDTEKPVHCAEVQSSGQLALEHLAAPTALTPVAVSFVQPAPVPVPPTVPSFVRHDFISDAGADPPYLRTQRLRI